MLRYDPLAGRWLYARRAANVQGMSFLCVAVAAGADLDGPFHRYVFELRQASGAHARSACQEMASWPDAYYFSHVMFDLQTGRDLGPQLCAYDRIAMLAGENAEGRCVDYGPSFGPVLPAAMPAGLWLMWQYSFTHHAITAPVTAWTGEVRTCTSG